MDFQWIFIKKNVKIYDYLNYWIFIMIVKMKVHYQPLEALIYVIPKSDK